MSDTELNEIATLEGTTTNRPHKPIVEMTMEELQEWVGTMRTCLTQYQSLVAEARVSKAGREKAKDTESLNMFE